MTNSGHVQYNIFGGDPRSLGGDLAAAPLHQAILGDWGTDSFPSFFFFYFL